jgi:hypothetical protein
MRDHQGRAARRESDRFREVRRRQRHGLGIGLADDEQVGIAGVNGELVLDISLHQAPFRRQVGAFCGLFERRCRSLLVGLGGGLIRSKEIIHRHHAVGKGRNVERRLDVNTHEMGAVTLRQLHCDVQSLRQLRARIAMNENGFVAHE